MVAEKEIEVILVVVEIERKGQLQKVFERKKLVESGANLTLIVNRRGRNGIPCVLNLDSRE